MTEQQRDPQGDTTAAGQGDDQQAYERALQRPHQDLVGDTEENRNLSGSSTYETLPDPQDDEGAGGQGRNT